MRQPSEVRAVRGPGTDWIPGSSEGWVTAWYSPTTLPAPTAPDEPMSAVCLGRHSTVAKVV
jgi:hypothetical protein